MIVFLREHCDEQIKNCSFPRYKSFPTAKEAEQFIISVLKEKDDFLKKLFPIMQKRVLHLEELKKACFKQCLYFSVEFDNFVQVYVDGSCFDNGKENAKAGAGVYFGYRHPMCVYGTNAFKNVYN